VMLSELSKRPKTYVDEIRKSERRKAHAECKEKMAAKAQPKPRRQTATHRPDELAPRRSRRTTQVIPRRRTTTSRPARRPTAARQGRRTPRTSAPQRGLQVYGSRPTSQRGQRKTQLRPTGVITQQRLAAEGELRRWYERESRKILQYYQAPNSPDYGDATRFNQRMRQLDRQYKGVWTEIQQAYDNQIGA